MWCLIVSIPDLCPLSYFDGMNTNKEKSMNDSYKFIMKEIEKVVEMNVPLNGIFQNENKSER